MGANNKISTILLVVTFIVMLIIPAVSSSTPPQPTSSNYVAKYALLDQTLTMSIPPSLYLYYVNQSHAIPQDSNYTNFITPYTVQPIADRILEVTQSLPHPQEQFADAVLSLVHQIPYNITGAKFPVETIVDNSGDCGALSLLAASIMKAGGLDVVLIKYTASDFAHMNVGVNLPDKPVYTSLFFSSTSMQYDNKTYWTAEATPEVNWRVGDQSPSLANTVAEIIPVDQNEQPSPGQISCSLSSLMPSAISLDISSGPADSNRSLLISGSIEPIMPSGAVTIYFSKDDSIDYVEAPTDANGSYAYLWNFTDDGTYYITASIDGNGTYAGADSEPVMVFVGPPSLLQFNAQTYNYFFGIPIGDIAIRPYMGVKDFLNAPVESNMSFSYSFSVLSTGHATSDVQTKDVTVPGSQYVVRDRSRNLRVVQEPPATLTVPDDVPSGLEPLALPNDFNETINSQFCFIIQKQPQGNYTFDAQGLDSYDVNGIKDGSNTTFFNATDGIDQSEWYKVSTAASQGGITTHLINENGTAIHTLMAPDKSESNSSQIVLLVANNVDSAVVLKDFQVNNGAAPAAPTPETVHEPPAPAKSLLPFALAVTAIAIVLTAAGIVIDVRKTRKRRCRGK